MDNYRYIRYGKRIVALWKDSSRCSEYDLIDQTKIFISTTSTSGVIKFLYDMLATVDLRYLVKTAELLSDGKTMLINDLGILWNRIENSYELLEYEDLEENEVLKVIRSTLWR